MPTSRKPPHPPRCFDQRRQPQRQSNKPRARENPRYLEVEASSSSRRPGGCGGFRLPLWFAPSRARSSQLGVCAVQQWVGAGRLAWRSRGVALFRPGRKEEGARGVLLAVSAVSLPLLYLLWGPCESTFLRHSVTLKDLLIFQAPISLLFSFFFFFLGPGFAGFFSLP